MVDRAMPFTSEAHFSFAQCALARPYEDILGEGFPLASLRLSIRIKNSPALSILLSLAT